MEARSYVLVARGDACFDSGRFKDALSAYLRADALGVLGQPRVQYRLAWLLVNTERPDPERAIKYCRQAVSAETQNPTFLRLLGELAIQLEDRDAEDSLRRALHANPRGPLQRNHNVSINLMLAELALSERRTRDAEQYLDAVERLEPANDKATAMRRNLRDPEVMKSIAADVKRRGKRRPR